MNNEENNNIESIFDGETINESNNNQEEIIEEMNIIEDENPTNNQEINNPYINNPYINNQTTNTQPNMQSTVQNNITNNGPSIMIPNNNIQNYNPANINNNDNQNIQNNNVQNNNIVEEVIEDITPNNTINNQNNMNNTENEINPQLAKLNQLQQMSINNISNNIQPPIEEKPAKKKKSHKKGIILIIILLLLVAALGIAYFYLKNINVYKEVIDNSFNEVLNNNYLSESSKITIQPTVTTENENLDEEIINYINKLNLEIDNQIDKDNNIMNLIFNLTYDKEDFINFGLYKENNEMYASFKNLYDKYIKLDEELEDVNIEDLKALLTGFKDALSNSITNEVITKKLDGMRWKNQLILNDKNTKIIIKNMVKELLGNEQFMSSLKNIDPSMVSELNSIQKSISSLPMSEEGDTSIEINIYTNLLTNEFISAEIINKDVDTNLVTSKSIGEKINGENTKITIEKDNNIYNITVKDSEEEINIKVTNTQENNIENRKIETTIDNVKINLDITKTLQENKKLEPIDRTKVISYEEYMQYDNEMLGNSLNNTIGAKTFMKIIQSSLGQNIQENNTNTQNTNILDNSKTSVEKNSIMSYAKAVELAYTQAQYDGLTGETNRLLTEKPSGDTLKYIEININNETKYLKVEYTGSIVTCEGFNKIENNKISLNKCSIRNGSNTMYSYTNGVVNVED